MFGFIGCTSSPKNAFSVKTEDYGQCRSLYKGEKIRYKRRLVQYVCEDNHVLIGKPYRVDGHWFFKSGLYNGKKVKKDSFTKITKSFHNLCNMSGSYGDGTEDIRKFHFDTKLKRCLPYSWSGKGGFVPFSSVDDCEVACYR